MKPIEKGIVSILILAMVPELDRQHTIQPNSEIINHVIDWLLVFVNGTSIVLAIYIILAWDEKAIGEE